MRIDHIGAQFCLKLHLSAGKVVAESKSLNFMWLNSLVEIAGYSYGHLKLVMDNSPTRRLADSCTGRTGEHAG